MPADGERYNRDRANFFGDDSANDPARQSTGSIYKANQAAFFGQEKPQPSFTINAGKRAQPATHVNTKSGVFRKDAAGFFGDDKFEVES